MTTTGSIYVPSVLAGAPSPFRDRAHAGRFLAEIVPMSAFRDPVVVAASPSGLEVAVGMVGDGDTPVELVPALPLVPPWSAELTYGAVAFDGSIVLHDRTIEILGLAWAGVREAIAAQTHAARRLVTNESGLTDLCGHTAILVDDGVAPVLVLRAAIAALRNGRASVVVVAVAAASRRDLRRLTHHAERVYCAIQRRRRDGPTYEDAAHTTRELGTPRHSAIH